MPSGKYPEHEKLTQVSAQSQVVGEFLEWLDIKNIHLMTWDKDAYDEIETDSSMRAHDQWEWQGEIGNAPGPEPKPTYKKINRPGWFHARAKGNRGLIDGLLNEFFNIDQGKIDAEKDQMLKDIRGVQSGGS